MLIKWNDIEKYLSAKGASANEINSKRQIFNQGIFQNILLTEFGLITEKTFGVGDKKLFIEKNVGTLKDLGSLDTYDLVDFIENHEISREQAATISPQQMSLLGDDQINKISKSLVEGYDDTNSISFALSHIVQTGFPYQSVKGKQHFERVNGALTVTMSAPNDIGLPSGVYPRLLFIHICSEIIKNKGERHISLGPSLKKFVVDELGKSWVTGKRGSAKKWEDTLTQMLATSFTATFKHTDSDGKLKGIEMDNVSIANKSKLWWDDDYDASMGAKIEVSESFADVLSKHATPLDSKAIKQLSELRSPLAIDLYMWLTYKYYRMEVNKDGVVRISWDSLYQQMGTNLSTVSAFKEDCIKGLEEVKRVYPAARFNTDHGCLLLITSPPHVSPERLPEQTALDL
jgi:hypothetical protein